ncbi:hypothetical protein ACOL2Y_06270 [Aliarcobacter butzleri]
MNNEETEMQMQLDNDLEINEELIEEIKKEILEKEQELLHIKKHGMKDNIITMIKARIK